MPDDLDQYFRNLPAKLRQQLAPVVEEQADGLADAIRAAAERQKYSGATVESVRVEDGGHDLEKVVMAGGELTTDERGYDHVLAEEFGTQKMAARPFFWPTVRVKMPKINKAISDAVEQALK